MKAKGNKFLIQKSKAFLLTFELALFCSFAFTQQFKVGLATGIVTSQVDGDTHAGYSKLGFYAGGFVTKKFSQTSNWSASFEINYIQKGSRKVPHPDKGDYSIYKLNLNYAEVPLLLKYAFHSPDSLLGEKVKFQLESGLAVGALVQSKEEDTSGPVTGGVPFEKKDLSYILGINYFASEKAIFNIRYEYSMIPVRKGAIGQYYQNWTDKILKPGYYNNLVIFSFRYQF